MNESENRRLGELAENQPGKGSARVNGEKQHPERDRKGRGLKDEENKNDRAVFRDEAADEKMDFKICR